MRVTYQVDLFCVEVLRQEGGPVQDVAALVLRDLVKLGADQQQRHWVLSKLLAVIITADVGGSAQESKFKYLLFFEVLYCLLL